MDKRKQASRYILSDFLSATLAWLIFNVLRYHEVAVYEGYTSLDSYLIYNWVWKGQLLIPFFWFVLYYFSGYYNKPFGKSRLVELFSTLITVITGSVLLFFLVILNDLPRSFEVYYELFFVLLGTQFVLTYIPRLLITLNGIRKVKRREWSLNVLIIGAGKSARRISQSLYELGYTIYGFVQDDFDVAVEVDKEQLKGTLKDLPLVMKTGSIHELILAVDTTDNQHLLSILYSLYKYSCPIKVLADKSNLLSKIEIKTIYGVPLVDITDNNLSEAEKNIKFFIDKIISILALVLLSPLFLYIAYRVKKDSPGPVFFKQERIGFRGRPFLIYKFRTMYLNSEEEGPLLANENDPRITPFGALMRKYRLDEFPQFWNVLKGDMSLVGPRPERKYFIDRIVREAPYYYLLHNVRPGITSLGMVKYGYATTVDQMIDRLKFDILYYENMSLVLDITILIHTIRTVFTGKGI